MFGLASAPAEYGVSVEERTDVCDCVLVRSGGVAGGGLGGGMAGGCGESASDGDDGLDGEEGTWCGWKTPELGRVDGEGL